MIGIIIQLALSWIILWFYEKGNLNALGLLPTKRRLLDFMVFFTLTALCCASGFFLRMHFAQEQWVLNPSATFTLMLTGIWWNIKSVLYEELIFRGVLLYILIRRLGALKAVIISSVAFGIYHWFSQGALGNPAQMAILFVMTGTMGLVYAYGFARTFSLYVPSAIHLGWNVTQSVVFSAGAIGDQLFVEVMPPPQVTVSYFVYFLVTFIPLLSVWGLNYVLLRARKQADPYHKVPVQP